MVNAIISEDVEDKILELLWEYETSDSTQERNNLLVQINRLKQLNQSKEVRRY